jgi:ribose 5-phosphate isomerase B
MERIAIGSDHGGVELKSDLAAFLRERGLEVIDLGTTGAESVDYPDFGEQVARAVVDGGADRGIIVCGTGIGISIAANKIPGIRAALVTDPFMARMAREHNDANILALGGRVLDADSARQCVAAWLDATFEGGRHQRRLDKISELEKKYCR